jgi:2,4-dichlorophenol 6-monooxygenase
MSSMCLADAGMASLLVERHHEPLRLPKAHLLNPRTMEIFRQHGLADDVYARGMPMENGYVRWMTSLRAGDDTLLGREIYRMDAFSGNSLRERYEGLTPCLHTNYAQIRLEPLMREHAERRPLAEIRYHHELIGLEQNAEDVTAEILNRDTGEVYTVCTEYVIGADGGKTVGDLVGVTLEGPKEMMEMITLHFSADLSEWIPDPAPMIHWFINPNAEGMWASGAMVPLGPTWSNRSEEYYLVRAAPVDDPARHKDEASVEHLRRLLNLPDLPVEVHRVSHWILDAIVADRYRVGRVLLAGDAVHRHSPTTGLGLNTAIGDAHALAWRLKAVLAGEASAELLDSYESERRPIGIRNRDWALGAWFQHPVGDTQLGLFPGQGRDERRAAFQALFAETSDGATRRAKLHAVLDVQRVEFTAIDVELGFVYEDGALVADGSERRQLDPWGADYKPDTRPGERLPHAWVEHEGNRVSTLDLVVPGHFLLLAGTGGQAWVEAANSVGAELGIPLEAVTISLEGGLPGLAVGGAILVRPDQYIAWRGGMPQHHDVAPELRAALCTILPGVESRQRASAGK